MYPTFLIITQLFHISADATFALSPSPTKVLGFDADT